MTDYESYFKLRNISPEAYSNYKLPGYISESIPSDKNIFLLDIGCGFGQALKELKKTGYTNLKGVDISPSAVEHCRSEGLDVDLSAGISDYCKSNSVLYDFIIMSHVLEHIPKEEMVSTLQLIRTKLLKRGGALLIAVPNAQANTGAYWAYEDFTHFTLFTSGSLYFVVKSAGFNTVEFLDPDCTAGSKLHIRIIKKIFLKVYKLKKKFWNKITGSSYHPTSPQIFSFELKVLASND